MNSLIAAPRYATLEEMQTWALGIMERRPDFVIGDDYLRRWWVIPRNAYANVYLHEVRKSDDDRALHDHPWPNSSYILFGGYIEHTPEGTFPRRAGDFIERPADALHRLEVLPGEACISLFCTGPKIREWGFQCPKGWVHWQDFTSPTTAARRGRGAANMPEHECFTVSGTAYLRNCDREDLRSRCIAVHYQKPPKKTENGTSIGLRFPMLIMAHYLENPEKVATKVARILNRHWDDPDA